MRNTKRWLGVVLAAAMTVSLAACGGGSGSGQKTDGDSGSKSGTETAADNETRLVACSTGCEQKF